MDTLYVKQALWQHKHWVAGACLVLLVGMLFRGGSAQQASSESRPPEKNTLAFVQMPDGLLERAVSAALGEESDHFNDTTFRDVTLGSPFDDDQRRTRALLVEPTLLTVPPHKMVSNAGRMEDTRVMVDEDSNRIVAIVAQYEGVRLQDVQADIIAKFGKTPQTVLEHKWRGMESLTVRYTFPQTIVRVIANMPDRGPTRVFIGVFDRPYVEKSLQAYGQSVAASCEWLKASREALAGGDFKKERAPELSGCEIREYSIDPVKFPHAEKPVFSFLFVDLEREKMVRAARDADKRFPGPESLSTAFDVAAVSSWPKTQRQQFVICPNASSRLRLPELKSLQACRYDATLQRSMVSDMLQEVASVVVQSYFEPQGDEITRITAGSRYWSPPDDTMPVERRIEQVMSCADGDRVEWTDRSGCEVRVTEKGAISLTHTKPRGL